LGALVGVTLGVLIRREWLTLFLLCWDPFMWPFLRVI
jgi:hypothetical protein